MATPLAKVVRAAAVLTWAAAACVVPRVAAGQGPIAVRVGADNDAFEFWIPPWDRPDQDYTSGVRGTLTYAGRSGIWPVRAMLAGTGTVTHRFGIGQSIYTGTRDAGQVPTAAQAASRPNAGWLFVTIAQQDSTARGTDEAGFDVGVVGQPALGSTMQRFFHSLGPQYNRVVDWTRQLPFEPGFVVWRDRARVVDAWSSGAFRGATRLEAGASLGTILTEARLGVSTDLGLRLGSAADAPRLLFDAAARAHGIVRDEFLDGTFFRKGDYVAREPAVLEGTAGLTASWRAWAATFRATRTTKRYAAQPRAAAFGTLEMEWRP